MKLRIGKRTVETNRLLMGRMLKREGLDKCLSHAPEILRPENRVNTERSLDRIREHGRCYVQKGRDTLKIEVI